MGDKVVIVGIGALGSHVALLARNWGTPLVLVDFDRVEQKNTLGQFHGAMVMGRNKAQAMQQTLLGMFRAKVEAVPHKITRDNADALLKGAKLVIDCTDNLEARRVIQDYVREAEIPCVHGALSADGAFGRIVWDEHFIGDAEGAPGQATCEDGENLPFFALAAAQLAVTVQRFLKTGERRSTQVTQTTLVRLA